MTKKWYVLAIATVHFFKVAFLFAEMMPDIFTKNITFTEQAQHHHQQRTIIGFVKSISKFLYHLFAIYGNFTNKKKRLKKAETESQLCESWVGEAYFWRTFYNENFSWSNCYQYEPSHASLSLKINQKSLMGSVLQCYQWFLSPGGPSQNSFV